jgi:hypothetical protein
MTAVLLFRPKKINGVKIGDIKLVEKSGFIGVAEKEDDDESVVVKGEYIDYYFS